MEKPILGNELSIELHLDLEFVSFSPIAKATENSSAVFAQYNFYSEALTSNNSLRPWKVRSAFLWFWDIERHSFHITTQQNWNAGQQFFKYQNNRHPNSGWILILYIQIAIKQHIYDTKFCQKCQLESYNSL